MANTNIINAVFGSGICAVTTSAYRANYGMVLRFSGIDLPTAFEVDFSNYDTSTNDSITAIGQNGEVQIPDQLWDSGLNIYAYVYLHPTDDSGVTVYTVTIPVLGRPNRTEEEPTPHEQTVIEQAISALNDAVEQTAADVETTTANAQAAAQSEANAATSERSAAASAGAALASQNAAESAAQSATESASGAAESARNAANSTAQAAESATDAQEYAEQAEQSAQSIEGDVERAERAAATATDKATAASGSAATASTKATEAAQSASSAASAAQNAASSATAAQSSATDAETAKQDAQDAQEAAEQAQAVAEQAKDDAVSAADRAEQAEQEVLSAMDGTYEDLTSGNAQQLLSTVTEANSVPYLFRPTASNADRAYLDEVVGGTVAWNQLVQNGNFESISGWSNTGSRPMSVNNGILHIDIESTTYHLSLAQKLSNEARALHKYFVTGSVKTTFNAQLNVRCGSSSTATAKNLTANAWSSVDAVITSNATEPNYFALFISNGWLEAGSAEYKNIMLIDLTQIFGSTVADYIYNLETASAGAGVAYFRKLFPNDYYEYNAGELLSVDGVSAKRTVGFNAWDEEWELGGLNGTNGNIYNSNTRIRSKNYISVVGGNAYYCKLPSAFSFAWYDADKKYIQGTDSATPNYVRTAPKDARYFKFSVSATTYNHDICINLSDPVRNGTYEPYMERTYPLDSSLTLRGIPKLDASGNLYYDGDTYAADGTVMRRFKEIVLDGVNQSFTASWGSATNGYAVYKTVTDIDNNGRPLILADKFINSNTGYNQMPVWSVGGNNGAETTVTFLFPSTITSTAEANNWLKNNNVTMIYPVATPTTETAIPYRHLQICDPNGTEEFVSTGIVPVGHNTRYPENLRAKIEGLPWNFNAIIAMTETTTAASKAYSVGDYFILNNVLYRVTSAIASGGTITIGTNCRATTIMDEIKALA